MPLHEQSGPGNEATATDGSTPLRSEVEVYSRSSRSKEGKEPQEGSLPKEKRVHDKTSLETNLTTFSLRNIYAH